MGFFDKELFNAIVPSKRIPKKCLKCGVLSRDWEGHHVDYDQRATLPLCYDCHDAVTDLNTLAAQYLRRKLSNPERQRLWSFFLAKPISKGLLSAKRLWMAELMKEWGWRPVSEFIPNEVWMGTQSTLHLEL